MRYFNLREEEIKNKVAKEYFEPFDCTRIVGNIDFTVTLTAQKKQGRILETESLLWAEAKKGKSDLVESIVQLILTIGKARTFDKHLLPPFLGAFDAEKIAFIPYSEVHDVFYNNDFNWNVAPSNHSTKEFRQVYEKVISLIEKSSLLFDFDNDYREIKEFVRRNCIMDYNYD